MTSVVAMLINIELFSYIGRVECEDCVKAIRHDMACAMLGLAERCVLCGSQVQRVNDFNNQKITRYQLSILPGVSYSIYRTAA
jgi:hypothetical protein